MKIIFVGLHNKPGKMPLCSSTKSGKLIDRIICLLTREHITDWQKTNLFDVDEWPTNSFEREKMAIEWYDRINPQENYNSIVILLGAATQRDFIMKHGFHFIKAAHPASKRSFKEMNEYVYALAAKIKALVVSRHVAV